jgi:PadR family transcriptional regulator, regulatory protein PadR
MQELMNCACAGKTLPKLLRPVILSLLSAGESHGYAITEKLGQLAPFVDQPPDHTGVYRALQAMEKEGLILSDWEQPKTGLGKRLYRLTPKGATCLKRWKKTLEEYRRTIDLLLASL